jgi:Asp-tRNA(Asn)/Glu-tRNA(Gln) amidotransferase A subunit family amidase
MARQVREKKVSPVELVQAHLERIERLNPKLNAFAHLDAEGALKQARGCGEAIAQARGCGEAIARGESGGAMHGVPVTVKSCMEVAGLRCESGTELRRGHVGETDATLVARLRSAGAVILGTTNVPEFNMSYETDGPLYGRTNNPWDLGRTPGGSSGGEAAAIAAGLSTGGLGTDGAGSIRVPAHFSGICGLKATPGRIPITGHYPPVGGPFTILGVIGPLTRTVEDLKLMFEVVAGADRGDAASAPAALRWPKQDDMRRLRVACFEDDGRTPVTPETRAAVQAAAKGLKKAGFEVDAFRPEGLERARQIGMLWFGWGGLLALRAVMGKRADELPITKEYLEVLGGEPEVTAEELLNSWFERDTVRLQVLAQMEEYPVLLCPVCSVPAFRHDERAWEVEGQTVRYLDAFSYTQWFNLLGFPAVSVPVGRSPEGLPIGVQVVGRPWEEEVVLSVAEVVEREAGGWQAPPGLD